MTKLLDEVIGFHVCDFIPLIDLKCPICGKEYLDPLGIEWHNKYGDFMMTTRSCRLCRRDFLLRCDEIVCGDCKTNPGFNDPLRSLRHKKNDDGTLGSTIQMEDYEKEWFYKFKFLQDAANDLAKENEYKELLKKNRDKTGETKIKFYKGFQPTVRTKAILDMMDENLPRDEPQKGEKLVACTTHHFVGKNKKCNQCSMWQYEYSLEGSKCKEHHHTKKDDIKQ